MKALRKILSVLLVLALFAAMALGSGTSSSDDVETPSSVSSGDSSNAKTDSSTSTESDASGGKSATTKTTARPAITIEEAVLFEQGGIKITAKGFNEKSMFGPEIKLLIENDSEKGITVQARNASVNGYMVETMFSADVAAGKKANDTLTFMQSDLDAAGISIIADVEFVFHIFDMESWDTLYDSEIVTIQTSAAPGFSYTYDNSGDQVYNENGVEIVIKGLSEKDSWLGPSVLVYISNTGNRNVTVQANNVSVNGFMIDPVFSCDVMAGKHAVDTITFMSSDFEKNEIETINEIELSFHIFDLDSWDTITNTADITISFN